MRVTYVVTAMAAAAATALLSPSSPTRNIARGKECATNARKGKSSIYGACVCMRPCVSAWPPLSPSPSARLTCFITHQPSSPGFFFLLCLGGTGKEVDIRTSAAVGSSPFLPPVITATVPPGSKATAKHPFFLFFLFPLGNGHLAAAVKGGRKGGSPLFFLFLFLLLNLTPIS